MPITSPEVVPHPSEPGLLELASPVLDKLLCDDPISDHLTVEPQPFARGKYATVRRTHRTIRVAGSGTRQEWYAAKYQRKQRRGTNVRHAILHEAAVLYLLRQEEHVVQLRGLYESSSEMILLLQLAPHGELQRLVDEAADGVGEAVAQECVRHTLLALAAMHALNLAHLDLKPQNLLLMAPPGPGCCVKLCDFGITRELRTNVELREVLGTPDYVAPEVLQYEPISLATDMWSVGVLAYVLLSGHSPFAGDTKQETFLNITQGELDFPEDLFEDVSSSARDFISALIQLNPQSRLSVKEALDHTWLSGFSSLPSTIHDGGSALLGGEDNAESPVHEKTRSNATQSTESVPGPQPDVVVHCDDSTQPSDAAMGQALPQAAVCPREVKAEHRRAGPQTIVPLRSQDGHSRLQALAKTSHNKNDIDENDVALNWVEEASPDQAAPQVCTSTATISFRCDGRPSPSHKPKLPPKPCNLGSPGALSPKKQNASKPPVARKPALPEKPRPLPSGAPAARWDQDPRATEQARTCGGNSAFVRRQKSNSPTSGSPRGSPQPSGLSSPRLSRSSRGSPQPVRSSRNTPQGPESSSPQLNRACKRSPDTARRSGESPQRSSLSPQLSRLTSTKMCTPIPKETQPSRRGAFPSSCSGASQPGGHKCNPVVARKTLSNSPARGASIDSSSPSRRPFSSSRLSSESPPPYRRSWPGSGASASCSDGQTEGHSRCRYSSSPPREERSSRSMQHASPTRHLSRRLESPNRNCCRPRLQDCPHSASLRAASPSPPRPAACTRSPRAARTAFARNVEALHKGAPTNQPLKVNVTQNGGRSNAPCTETPHAKPLDSTASNGVKTGTVSVGSGLSPASRKTPSHSPPMFQPAPKKSNTVSDFFTTSCSLRARDCSEKSDGEILPFPGIVDTSHPRVGLQDTPTLKGALKGTRDRLPLHSASPKTAHQPKPNQAQRQTYEIRGTKPVPKPRPAHLTIKSPDTLQCPPVSSCFAVFSSSSLSSPETHNSLSSSQSSGSLPSRRCLSPCSTSSSCSDFSFTKPWPDTAPHPGAAAAPFSLKLQRDKENDRNALNSPTEGQKTWHPDGGVPQDDSAMDVDPYSSLETDEETFASRALVLMRRDEDLPGGSVSHC